MPTLAVRTRRMRDPQSTPRRAAIALVPGDQPRSPVPLPPKGRLLGVEDIQELLPKRGGKPVSRWWVTHHFAPHLKHKTGRDVWWWELEVFEFLEKQHTRRPA